MIFGLQRLSMVGKQLSFCEDQVSNSLHRGIGMIDFLAQGNQFEKIEKD